MALSIHNCLEDSLEKYQPKKLKMAVSHFFKLYLNKISKICIMLVFFSILKLQILALFFFSFGCFVGKEQNLSNLEDLVPCANLQIVDIFN